MLAEIIDVFVACLVGLLICRVISPPDRPDGEPIDLAATEDR